MASSPLPIATPVEEEDEWDADGFVIPSLGMDELVLNEVAVKDSKPAEVKKEESIYLGPHGVPPSQARKLEQNSLNRKQKFKQKVKDANARYNGIGRENKVDSLRDLVGGGKMPVMTSKSSSRDWLDPHCHESQFDRRR